MNPWRGLRGLPRSMWIVFTATLINRAGTMVLPFLILYFTRSLGYSGSQAGFALTIYGVGAIIAAPISGKLCDRVGALMIMELSPLFSGLLLLVFPLVKSYAGTLCLTFIWAIISEALRPASLAIIAELVSPEQRRPAFVLNRLAVNLGMSVGPAVGGLLVLWSFAAIFVVDAVTAIAAGVVLLFAGRSIRTPRKESISPTRAVANAESRRFGAYTDKHLLFFSVAIFLVMLVFFQLRAGLPLFLVQDLHLSEAIYGLLFLINTLLIVFIEVPLNNGMSRWPHRRSLSLGAILFAVGFGALTFVTGLWGVVATVVVWTFGEMILLPGSAAYVAEIAPSHKRGEYMGLFTMAIGVAGTIGPVLGSAALEKFGATILWSGTFILGLFSALMLFNLSEATRPSGMDMQRG